MEESLLCSKETDLKNEKHPEQASGSKTTKESEKRKVEMDEKRTEFGEVDHLVKVNHTSGNTNNMAGVNRQEQLTEDSERSYKEDEMDSNLQEDAVPGIVLGWVEKIEDSRLSPNMPELLSPLPEWVKDQFASRLKTERRDASAGTTPLTVKSVQMIPSSRLPEFRAAVGTAQMRADSQSEEGRAVTNIAVSEELRKAMRSEPINVIVGKRHARIIAEGVKNRTERPPRASNTAMEDSDVDVLELGESEAERKAWIEQQTKAISERQAMNEQLARGFKEIEEGKSVTDGPAMIRALRSLEREEHAMWEAMTPEEQHWARRLARRARLEREEREGMCVDDRIDDGDGDGDDAQQRKERGGPGGITEKRKRVD